MRTRACDCSCHDCCIPLWAACDECEDNHPDIEAAQAAQREVDR
jgi:hypothetical protein